MTMTGTKHKPFLNYQQKLALYIEAARQVFNVDPMDKRHSKLNSWARAAIFVKIREEYPDISYHIIGAHFNKNRATVIHHTIKHADNLKYDKLYADYYKKFLLKSGTPIDQANAIKNETKARIKEITNQLTALHFSQDEIAAFFNDCIKSNMKPEQLNF